MSTAPKPFPLYTDGTSIFFTTDGVNFNSVGGGGQDPSNVAITGGSIVGTSVQGFTPAQLAAYLSFVGADWNQKAWNVLKAGAPGVTAYKEAPLLMVPLSQANGAITGDKNQEGGGIGSQATSRNVTGTIFQNTAAGNWGFSARAIVPALSSGVNVQIGLTDVVNGHHYIMIAATFSVDTAHFYAEISVNNGANIGTDTIRIILGAWDANPHDWSITDDGTTLKVWEDGAVVGSTIVRTCIPVATPLASYLLANNYAASSLLRYGYAFVQ